MFKASPVCAFVILLVMLGAACSRGEPFLPGRYEALSADGKSTVVLELADGGSGSWAVGDDYAELRWDVRSSRIVLHTKGGGILQGDIITQPKPMLRIAVAGSGLFEFSRKDP